LVVDDEPAVRRVLGATLSADGHIVTEASGAREALEILESGRFDAVLTDRAMPGMNGEQLALAVKRAWPDLPVVLVTGFGDFMMADGERPIGVRAVVAKPVRRPALRAALESVLSSPVRTS
jgi:DNA-binding NtrC family response regulator